MLGPVLVHQSLLWLSLLSSWLAPSFSCLRVWLLVCSFGSVSIQASVCFALPTSFGFSGSNFFRLNLFPLKAFPLASFFLSNQPLLLPFFFIYSLVGSLLSPLDRYPQNQNQNLPPLYFDGVLLPFTDSFKILGMVCNKQINLNTKADAALRPCTALPGRHFQSQGLSRNTTLLTGYTRTYGFSRRTLFLLACMRVRFGPLLTYNKAKRWLLAVLKRKFGVRDTTPSWCVMHECGLEPLLHFNWFRAAMRLYNSLVLHNGKSPTCWHIAEYTVQ